MAKLCKTADQMQELSSQAREDYAKEILAVDAVMTQIINQAIKGFDFVIIDNKEAIPNLEHTTYAQGLHKRLAPRGYKLLWQDMGDFENLKIMWG